MNTERMYGTLCTLVRELDANTEGHWAEEVIADPARWAAKALPAYSAAASLLADLRRQMDVRTTPGTAISAVKRVIAGASASPRSPQGVFPWEDKFVVCDGYRLLRLNADITSLPHVGSGLDVGSIMGPYPKGAGQLALPAAGEVKAFLAAEKARKEQEGKRFRLRPYCLEGWMYVNPRYLLDMMQALPGCTAERPERQIDPIYFRAENGDGILCPMRPLKECGENA